MKSNNTLAPIAYPKQIQDFASKSFFERTGKHLAENESFFELSGKQEICRIVLGCGRLYVSANEEYFDTISDYLHSVRIYERITAPVFYKEILGVLGLDSSKFLLEPSEEFVQNIRYNVFHTLDFACTAETFKPREYNNIRMIKRGDEQYILDDSFDDTMYCITDQGHFISTGYFKPNTGLFDNTCSMQVFTRPDYRKRGYGTASASAATQAIVKNGKCALWVCQIENYASRKIAESLGYILLGGQLRIVT